VSVKAILCERDSDYVNWPAF